MKAMAILRDSSFESAQEQRLSITSFAQSENIRLPIGIRFLRIITQAFMINFPN